MIYKFKTTALEIRYEETGIYFSATVVWVNAIARDSMRRNGVTIQHNEHSG